MPPLRGSRTTAAGWFVLVCFDVVLDLVFGAAGQGGGGKGGVGHFDHAVGW